MLREIAATSMVWVSAVRVIAGPIRKKLGLALESSKALLSGLRGPVTLECVRHSGAPPCVYRPRVSALSERTEPDACSRSRVNARTGHCEGSVGRAIPARRHPAVRTGDESRLHQYGQKPSVMPTVICPGGSQSGLDFLMKMLVLVEITRPNHLGRRSDKKVGAWLRPSRRDAKYWKSCSTDHSNR